MTVTAAAGLGVAALVVAPGFAAGASGRALAAARTVSCRAERNATQVRATAVTCGAAAGTVSTYEGAPAGCVTATRCTQSGTNGRSGQAMVDSCRRTRLKVSCAVYLKSAHGALRDPRVDGVTLSGRWATGTVTFTMRHDPS
ncbi:MAG TPA: hypothetical protein VHX62_05075 [Solirubrobacteraceae bacterium]|nr:hypothetical protein [Solirubrobacteraceae bacterium]